MTRTASLLLALTTPRRWPTSPPPLTPCFDRATASARSTVIIVGCRPPPGALIVCGRLRDLGADIPLSMGLVYMNASAENEKKRRHPAKQQQWVLTGTTRHGVHSGAQVRRGCRGATPPPGPRAPVDPRALLARPGPTPQHMRQADGTLPPIRTPVRTSVWSPVARAPHRRVKDACAKTAQAAPRRSPSPPPRVSLPTMSGSRKRRPPGAHPPPPPSPNQQ